MKRAMILALALGVALPAGAADINGARFAHVATNAMMAQIVQIPSVGSSGTGVGDNNTWTGTNIFTTATTFGTAAAAANSFVTGANTICFEGATADAFETCITVTDPAVDSTFTIGYSPDGNPWIGPTAGDSAGATETGNVLIGSAAGTAMSGTSTNNVFIGHNTGDAVTTSDNSLCVGGWACRKLESGLNNTSVGYFANVVAADTASATSIGASSIAGTEAVAIGYGAEAYAGSVVIGHAAGDAAAAADADNVFVGAGAGGAASGTSTDHVFVGDGAGAAVTTGDNNVFVGSGSGDLATDSEKLVCIGTDACNIFTTGANNGVYIGYNADAASTGDDLAVAVGADTVAAEQSVAVGGQAKAYAGTVSVGQNAGLVTTSNDGDNVFIGQSAGIAAGNASASTDNVVIGDTSGGTIDSSDQLVIIGADADVVTGTESGLVAIGFGAMAGDTGGISIGYQAGASLVAGGYYNTLIGHAAGDALNHANSDGNTAVGYNTLAVSTNGANNTAVGANAGDGSTGVSNTFLGGGSDAVGAIHNAVAVGYLALVKATGGTAVGLSAETADGVSIGYQAGDATAAADVDNVFIGNSAGTAANGTSTDNTCIGDAACDTLTTGDRVVVIGADADVGAGNANDSVIVGADAVATGSNVIIIGHSAGSGPQGVSIGEDAGDAQSSGDVDNTYVGYQAGTSATGTSTQNTCIGEQSCNTLTTGDRNVALGANTTVGTNTDSDVTVIGESMVGKASDSILLGYGGQEAYYHHGTAVTLTESTATALVRVSVAQGASTGGKVSFTVNADDGTDLQQLTNVCTFSAINKTGTEVCTLDCLCTTGNCTEASSSGTLAMEAKPTCVSGAADTVDFLVDMVSSLTQTTLEAKWGIWLYGPGTITPQ